MLNLWFSFRFIWHRAKTYEHYLPTYLELLSGTETLNYHQNCLSIFSTKTFFLSNSLIAPSSVLLIDYQANQDKLFVFYTFKRKKNIVLENPKYLTMLKFIAFQESLTFVLFFLKVDDIVFTIPNCSFWICGQRYKMSTKHFSIENIRYSIKIY